MARRTAVARDVWVRCDRWPDPKDLRTWADDIFRIEGAETPQQRAIALWKWTLIAMGRNGMACHQGERGLEGYLMDTLKYLAVYGGHYCDGLSRLMVNAWEAARCGRGRKVVICRLGHTVAELRYRDDDGRMRWHVFDPQHGWYVFSRDGSHIAGIAEIDDDPDLLLNPADPPRPYFYAWSRHDRYLDRDASTRNPSFGDAPRPQHRMTLDLRRGERWRRTWEPGRQYWPYRFGPKARPAGYVWVEQDIRGGGIADTFLGEHVEPYLYPTPRGNWLLHEGERTPRCRMTGDSELRYAVPLAGGRFREGACRVKDVASKRRASAGSALVHAARLNDLGVLVYEVRTPYLITDAQIEATVRTGTDAQDMLAFHVSVDGGQSWHQVWGNRFAQRPKRAVRPKRVVAPFGAKAYHAGAFSVVGKYGYQVRIDFLAKRDVAQVGLDDLTLVTHGLCNMMALPALLPGRNTVTVAVKRGPADATLRVLYRWDETARGRREVVRRLPATGGAFTITVGGASPRDVRMREVAVELM